MIKRFIIRGVSKKFKGIQKLEAQKLTKPQVIIKQKKKTII